MTRRSALTRTKPRWVTEPGAIYVLLKLGALKPGDYMAFRTTDPKLSPRVTERPIANVQARRGLTIECLDGDDASYVVEVYANEALVRSDESPPTWTLIGWRRG